MAGHARASETPAGAAGLPPELAFLPAAAVAPAVLHRVAATARREGVTAEQVLLAEGHTTADCYYRLLAARLRLPYAERPLRPALEAAIEDVLRTGRLRLAPNACGWTVLIAPRGATLVALLEARPRSDGAVAIMAPDRLEALIRYAHRPSVARQASHGLPDWNEALSARNGLSAWQLAAGTLVTATLCASAWLAPVCCLAAMSLVFYCGFLANALLRLLATAASRRPAATDRVRLPGPALPTYTVVVPLFREAREVKRLVAALGRLDYPVLGSKLT